MRYICMLEIRLEVDAESESEAQRKAAEKLAEMLRQTDAFIVWPADNTGDGD
jgi:hypothetical protein